MLVSTDPSAFKNSFDVPPVFLNDVAVTIPTMSAPEALNVAPIPVAGIPIFTSVAVNIPLTVVSSAF